MPWIENPTESELLQWYSRLFKVFQVEKASGTLDPSLSPLKKMPLSEALNLLGSLWTSMDQAFSGREELAQSLTSFTDSHQEQSP